MRSKPSELLDLRTIPMQDLKLLIEICASRQANKYFEDNFVILSRILFAQHECSEMSEYNDEHLAEAEAVFLDLLERNQQLPHDHPTQTFLRVNFTATYDERQRRAKNLVVCATRSRLKKM
jgi:hypothetical protein